MPKLVKDRLTSAEYIQELERGCSGSSGKQNVKVSFSNVSAHVRLPDGNNKNILDGISGSAHAGQVMAVMGPTGCGKTTFLSALGHRLDSSVALSDESKISWGGQSWSPSLKRRIGFIEQDDVTFPHLTVREALTFAARLRISGSDGYRVQRVDQLLREMHLEGCSDVLIGGGLVRGISGGQRKRVCIATELISKPKFLFCDEPTSGLDSETALVIIGVLQELTIEVGMCIICSIHQPSSQVYGQFDDLCFLDAGRCVYFGKAGGAAIDYFQSVTKMTCPSQYNPPDWFMEQAVKGKLAGVKMEVAVVSDFHCGNLDLLDPGFAVSFKEQVSVIFQRSWIKTKVAKLNTPFYLQQIAIGAIMGILFVGLGNAEADIFSRVSFAFNFLMGSIYLPVMEVLFVFLEDSLTLRKDLLAKAHHPLAFYIAKIFSVTPVLTILLLLLTVTSYVLGLYKWGSVVQFFALLAAEFVVGNVFASLGLCIGAFVRNPSYLMTVTMICLVWVFAFSGFFVPVDQMSPWLSWMVYINPATYSFALYFQIFLKVGRAPSFVCAELSQYASCDEPSSSGMISPDEIVAEYDLDSPIRDCFAVLVGMYVGCFCIGYVYFLDKIKAWMK